MRLDFFGDTLESIKAFDAETQRTTKLVQKLALMPVSEVAFGEAADGAVPQRYVSCSAATRATIRCTRR